MRSTSPDGLTHAHTKLTHLQEKG